MESAEGACESVGQARSARLWSCATVSGTQSDRIVSAEHARLLDSQDAWRLYPRIVRCFSSTRRLEWGAESEKWG